jgi:hypothetical protein
VDAGLLEVTATGRYTLHQVIVDYVSTRFGTLVIYKLVQEAAAKSLVSVRDQSFPRELSLPTSSLRERSQF